MGALKEFFLHKLTLRVMYIVAAFSSGKVIAFASSNEVQTILVSAGVQLQILDAAKLKNYILASVLVGGEFIYHWFHTKVILPKVSDVAES